MCQCHFVGLDMVGVSCSRVQPYEEHCYAAMRQICMVSYGFQRFSIHFERDLHQPVQGSFRNELPDFPGLRPGRFGQMCHEMCHDVMTS